VTKYDNPALQLYFSNRLWIESYDAARCRAVVKDRHGNKRWRQCQQPHEVAVARVPLCRQHASMFRRLIDQATGKTEE
jgi:hypothetical protein